MALSPTIPNLYRYGFLTARAVDLLASPALAEITEEQRELLSACKELVKAIIQGEQFILGPNPDQVQNLRPEDVEAFNYVLNNDEELRELVQRRQDIGTYLDRILRTLDSVASAPAKPIEEQDLQTTRAFLGRIADAIIETAKQTLRRAPSKDLAAIVSE